MILGLGSTQHVAESFQVGSVSLSSRYFPDGRYTEEAFRAAQVAAGAELEEALELFGRAQWSEALGSSGTAGAVSQLLAASNITDGTITPDGLRWCMRECLKAGHQDAIMLPGLKPERRAVLGGGLAILSTLATQFNIEALLPAKGALRQGVIFDLDERLTAARDPAGHDLRDETVHELQHRFSVDVAQAERVQAVAVALHADLQHGSSHDSRRELEWAAALHEAGMMISHHDHHRHSAYLLAHADAAGFSQNQQRRLGELVLGQRGGLRKMENALLDPSYPWQLLALRLAVLLCHARSAMPHGVARLSASGRNTVLTLDPRWAESHPRTLHLLREEALAWTKVNSLRLLLGS
jgi:exopolyphosphatase/guanosine-5'-triphosphate,3'-diphosphate pyrophosphatase